MRSESFGFKRRRVTEIYPYSNKYASGIAAKFSNGDCVDVKELEVVSQRTK